MKGKTVVYLNLEWRRRHYPSDADSSWVEHIPYSTA